MIVPASRRKSLICSGVSSGRCISLLSVEQSGEALLDAVRNVKRQRLNGGGRVHAAGSHPDAAIDDKQVLHVVAAAPFVDDRALGVGAHPGPPCQPPFTIGLSTQMLPAPAAARTCFARVMPWSIIFRLLALMV